MDCILVVSQRYSVVNLLGVLSFPGLFNDRRDFPTRNVLSSVPALRHLLFKGFLIRQRYFLVNVLSWLKVDFSLLLVLDV